MAESITREEFEALQSRVTALESTVDALNQVRETKNTRFIEMCKTMRRADEWFYVFADAGYDYAAGLEAFYADNVTQKCGDHVYGACFNEAVCNHCTDLMWIEKALIQKCTEHGMQVDMPENRKTRLDQINTC